MNTNNPNPAFGADLEPYHGIPTFMRQPASSMALMSLWWVGSSPR